MIRMAADQRRSLLRYLLPRLACFGAVLAVAQVFFVQYCDLLFDCGCRALWAGADEACNIHNPAPPHCPWCLNGGTYGQWSFGAIVIAQALISMWPGRFGTTRALSALLAFPVIGAVAGIAAGLATGYWK